ncbi:MAG: aspartate--tRNA ligase, partial [Clostridia bacterium]|nr:aspartate--tRNA ligase [Clostridia bacterium]
MAEFMNGMKRTDYCASFSESDVGKEITVMGWTDGRRDLGSLIFVDLRDRTGILQIVFDESVLDKAVFEKATTIRHEFVLAAKGTLRIRSSINENIPTGRIELLVSEFKILSEAETTPFEIEAETNVNEMLRLKYRYLDLRRAPLQQNLMMRAKIANAAREYLVKNGFLEIETPFLGKSTPEGARDYLVPSRVHQGTFYALPQSPQLYKQLLMISGFDRYFQITKCFRDEDLRANRQPEFTQIDLEMSFVEDENDVMTMMEGLLAEVFMQAKGISLSLPLPRLTWQEAMDRFGSDKPDTRFGMELVNLSDLVAGCGFKVFTDAVANGGSVRAINAKGFSEKLSRKAIDALGEFVK